MLQAREYACFGVGRRECDDPTIFQGDIRSFEKQWMPLTHQDQLDWMILNHAVMGPTTRNSLSINSDDLTAAIEVNVVSCLRVIRQCLSALKRSKDPRIALIMSKGGLQKNAPAKGLLAYKVSKAAQIVLGKTLSADLKELGIPLVLINPGWVSTRIGGKNAPHSPEFSAENILNIFDNIGLNDSGKAFDWNGTELTF